jgi:hypothetical protein
MFGANMHSVDINQSCKLFDQAGQSDSALGKRYQASYDSMKQALQNCRSNGRPAALGLLDCGQLGRDNDGKWFQEDPQMEMLSWIEGFSGCGGFCASDLPLFGFPEKPSGKIADQSTKMKRRAPCYTSVVGELQVRGSTRGAFISFLCLPLLASVIGAGWILCYPPPRMREDYMSDDGDLESTRLLAWGYSNESSPEQSDEEHSPKVFE